MLFGSARGWSLVKRIRQILLADWRVHIQYEYREKPTKFADGLTNLDCENDNNGLIILANP
jgi:hypothetical protein